MRASPSSPPAAPPAAGGTARAAGPRATPPPPAAGRQSAPRRRQGWLWPAVIVALLGATMVWSLTLGHADITVARVLASGWHGLCEGLGAAVGGSAACPADPLSAVEQAIVWQGRAPRVLAAAAVGAGLAVAGAVMQALVRNPLADPYLLGVSSGASVGAVLVLVLGVGLLLPVAAFLGGLVALVLTLTLAATRGGGLDPARTVLAGVAVAQAASAVLSLVIFTSATGDSYREILTWLLGSFGAITWERSLLALGATLVLGTLLAGQGRVLDAITMGDVAAAALGVDVRRTRWLLLVVVTVLTGLLVSVSGAIGFVGLVVPHAVRLLVGARNTRVLLLAPPAGALFLLLADTAARTAFAPQELPVGVLTAAIGAPVFAVLLRRSRA